MQNNEQEQQLQNSWVTNAEAWTQVVRAGQIESRRAGTDEAILKAVSQRVTGRVLDVGCGEGWLARALAAGGFEVAGVDGSEALITRAQELGGGTFWTLGYTEIAADPSRLQGPYAAAVCNFSLLGEDLAPLLSALRTALTGDGWLFIQTVHPFAASKGEPYHDGWRTENFTSFGESFKEAMPWYFRTVGSWVRLLRSTGFNLVDCIEPIHPASGQPLSLLLIAQPGVMTAA